jgi:type III secretion protein T
MEALEALFRMGDFERALRDLLVPMLALGMAAARPLGLAMTFPAFTRAEIGGLLRSGWALAVALPIMGASTVAMQQVRDNHVVFLALLAAKEVLVGALIGFLMGLPFWAIQSVGELVDAQRGITSEFAPTDPSTKSQASVTAGLLSLVALALFIAANGFQTVLAAIYSSYQLWPQTQFLPKLSIDGTMSIMRMVDELLRYSFLVAGPIVGLMLLIDLSVMLIGRAAPHLNSNELAPTIKNIAFIIFFGVYLVYLAGYMRDELASVYGLSRQLQEFLR